MIYTAKPTKMTIYINSAFKTMDQVKAETNADVIINGGLFNPDWTPCCHLKADGKLIASDQWTYFGYGWHKDKADLRLTSQYSDLDNYICCVCLLRQGKKETLLYPSGMGGARPRTALGLFPDGRVWFYASDEKRSPEALQSFAESLGLDSCLMLDGGGSTQGISPVGAYRQTRKVHNFILAWTDDLKCPYPKPDGLIYRGARGESVKWLQWMLNYQGADLVVDGIYGGKTYAAVITFQRSHDLVADGIVGNLTKAKLMQKEQTTETEIISPAYVWSRTPSKRASTQFIILHHAGVSSATAESIHNYHKSLGWCGIGYNMYVAKDGKIYLGRPMDAVGAHTVGYNAASVGICFEGNFENESMSPKQIAAGKKAIQYARSMYPNTQIKMHRECDATACPGRNFPIGEFR